MALISDAQSTNARITYHEPDWSRILTKAVSNNTCDVDLARADNEETDVDAHKAARRDGKSDCAVFCSKQMNVIMYDGYENTNYSEILRYTCWPNDFR